MPMDTSPHNLQTLFEQLGLPGDQASIDSFVRTHRPLAADTTLESASIWNRAQAAFLHEAIEEDSDWAEIVDELDAMLRAKD